MALTPFQVTILRLLADRRKKNGISFVAGGAALNTLLDTQRRSHDIDFFHDATKALQASWDADCAALVRDGYSVAVIREVPSFVEADIRKGGDSVLIQWVRNSAYRFFPPCEDPVLGLTLHPFDLATNKVLAMAGRLEPRDWIDSIECHRKIQPLGYLIWAACGKDPGVNPDMVLSDASRLHYSQTEIDGLDFASPPPSAAGLSVEWKSAISEARRIIDSLPGEHIGECLLDSNGQDLYRGTFESIQQDLRAGRIRFHQGSIGGAWPRIVGHVSGG